MNLRDRILASLSVLGPCRCAYLWRVMMRDLTSDHVKRETVYRMLYDLMRAGLVRRGREGYDLTDEGRRIASRVVREASNQMALFQRNGGAMSAEQSAANSPLGS